MPRLRSTLAAGALCAGALAVPPAPARAQAPARPAGVAPPSRFHARYEALARARGARADSVRLAELFALDWERAMVESPEAATALGYPGQNARWTDASLPAIRRRRAEARDPLAVLETIERAALSPARRLDYDLFRRQLETALAGQRFPEELFAISQRWGPQYLPDVIAQMPTATARDYADLLARLDSVPAVVEQTIALLDSGLAVGVTPPRVTLREVPKQVRTLLAGDPMASPFAAPFAKMPASIAAAERTRLRAAGEASMRGRVLPALRRLHAYLESTYVPRARATLAMRALPDGPAWYAHRVRTQTTTSRTPEEIHRVGLAEVARIRAAMDSVMRASGFAGTFPEFVRFLRTDRRFFHTDSASLVRAYRDVAKRADPGLTRLFGRLPRLPYGVEAVPTHVAPSQTTAYYMPGSPQAGRAGAYTVNTYALDTRPAWEMEALTLHEAVPGHHLQIALAQELEDVPEFRRHGWGDYTAFVEGWALYAESLGPALGFYQDPYSRFGQLTYEVWRAIRLVLDTGIHHYGWTREQAIAYFAANSAKTEHDIAQEVDRYIAWPGQALAYKLGELQIRRLRADAERALGERFDVRAFHDLVLGGGAVPLDVLEERVRAWVADGGRTAAAGAGR